MKNIRELEESLNRNHFHPLNFAAPTNIKQLKPYEVMLDGTIISVYSFYSESQEKEMMLKISTCENRQYNENLTYMMDNLPDCMLTKYNSFSFTEKNGITYYYSVFRIINSTLDSFIYDRLDFSQANEISEMKVDNHINFKHLNNKPWQVTTETEYTSCVNKEDDFIREDELIYLWKQIIYAFSDLQKARICHRDIRPDNIAMISIDECGDNRKTNYTLCPPETRQCKNSKVIRESVYSYDRNTNVDSVGFLSGRGKSLCGSLRKQYSVEPSFKPIFDNKNTSRDKSVKGRSTDGFGSSIIGKIKLKIFNFDASEVIDHHVSSHDLEYGIEMKNYPCHNDIYASQYVLEYIEANMQYDVKIIHLNQTNLLSHNLVFNYICPLVDLKLNLKLLYKLKISPKCFIVRIKIINLIC